MPSMRDGAFVLGQVVPGPVRALAGRSLKVSFALPSPMLRVLGVGESPAVGMWSEWLAEWGWTWAVEVDACAPKLPLVDVWFRRAGWPAGFDARVMALAHRLRLRVDGVPLGTEDVSVLDRSWQAVASVTRKSLADVLSLALMRGDRTIFDFGGSAPAWPEDVARVLLERRPLANPRRPRPAWLATGYRFLGEDGIGSLRELAMSFSDCQGIRLSLIGDERWPAGFELAFWWEAVYCLTERHAFADAHQAQEALAKAAGELETQTGLVEPLWRHQQGRLHYYAGDHEAALAAYLREYAARSGDLAVVPMLAREIANVLSDIGCIDGARRFAERSLDIAREQCMDVEEYKTLGRLAEVSIKEDDIERARALLEASLDIQERTRDRLSPAQTQCYLGHAALLAGDLEGAQAWYDKAEANDSTGSALPYVTMGRFSLASRQGNAVALEQLWSRHRSDIVGWAEHATHVLPAAVATLAASGTNDEAAKRLPVLARTLVDARYAVEAIGLLSALPKSDASSIGKTIVDVLSRWQRMLKSIPPDVAKDAGTLAGTARLLDAAQRANSREEWGAFELVALTYPMSLAVKKR